MPGKKIRIGFFDLMADLTGYYLNAIFWLFCGVGPVALIVVVLIQPQLAARFGWALVAIVAVMVLSGFIARWFSKGLFNRRKIRTLLISLLLLALSLSVGFVLSIRIGELPRAQAAALYPTASYVVLWFGLGVILLIGLLTGRIKREINANKGPD